ncbi:MAG: response regulator [Candidatus Sumerlaeaceae bacterium]
MSINGRHSVPIQLLLVEDNPADVRLTKEAIREADVHVELHMACDGAEALAFLRHEGVHANAPRPDIILLDLNLPKMHGCDVLAHIKSSERLKTIPTVILTNSEVEADIVKTYELQATCYLSKPVQVEAIQALIKCLDELPGNAVSLPMQTAVR